MFKKPLCILFSLLLILWIGGYVMFVANIAITITPIAYEKLEKIDAIIVLTGGNDRVGTGLILFSHNISKNLFITGVNKSVTKSDLTSIVSDNIKLPECCITLGHVATTTYENALETQEWLNKNSDIKSIRLVTSSYHMDRAMLEFGNIIQDTKIIAHPVTDNHNQLQSPRFWKITFGEYNKIILRKATIILQNKGYL